MSDLNDLFNEASVVGGEAEEIDWFVISHDFRTIAIPSKKLLAGVTSDEKVNRLHFKCPRTYGDVDLNDFSFRINYTNASGEGDMYLVTDKSVSGDEIQFSWLVGRHACEYSGNISFVVCAIETDGNSTILREYNTAIHTLQVVQGLETSEEIHDEVLDVVAQMQSELDGLDETVSQLVDDDLGPIIVALVDADLWRIGHIMSATGVDLDSPTYNRMRTKTFIPENIVQIVTDTGYGFYIYCYSKSDGSYLGMWNGTTTVKSWVENWYTGTVGIKKLQNNYRLRILANRQGGVGPQLTPEDNAQMYRFISFTDESLSIAGKAADAKVVGERLTALNDIAAEKASGIINTVSGTIASFSDGADGVPINSLVAQIEPVQDLHGYDRPWPARGGKNLLDISKCIGTGGSGTTLVLDGNEFVITCENVTWGSSSMVQNSKINFIAGVSYVFSAYCTVLTRDSNYQNPKLSVRNEKNSMKATANLPSTDNTEQRISFVYTPTEDFTGYFSVVITGVTAGSASVKVRNPMIEVGSAVTDYEPYENLCPISGHAGMTGKRTGKNVAYFKNKTTTSEGITYVFADGVITANGTATSNSFSGNTALYLNAGTYRIYNLSPQINGAYIVVQNSESSVAWTALASTSGFITISDTFTLDRRTKVSVRARIQSGTTVADMVFRPMLVVGTEEPTEFEPYIAQDISVNWETEAGTVYGGTPDVINGALPVDRETFTIDGSTSVTSIAEMTNNMRFWVYTNAKFQLPTNVSKIKSDRLLFSNDRMADEVGFSVSDQYPQSLVIKLPKGTCEATVEGICAYLQANPIQFVLPLARPVTYQLTPQEVTTLLGMNNIWTDVGPVSVEYQADTKLYIDNKIAEAISALNA